MKKLISILLSAVILLGIFPQNMTVKAADAQTDLETMPPAISAVSFAPCAEI